MQFAHGEPRMDKPWQNLVDDFQFWSLLSTRDLTGAQPMPPLHFRL